MNDSGPDGLPPPESFSRCERSVERSVPVPEPNLKSIASLRASSMMSSMSSSHALDEAGRALRIFVRIFRLHDRFRLGIPMPIALRALDAVLMKQPDVEPHRAVERPVLVQREPGELAIESLAVGGRGEIAVLHAPIGDRAADAMDQLPDAALALRRVDLAVEIFADDDIRRQLAPRLGDFAIGLLEEHLARFAFDRGGAEIPFDGVERIGDVRRGRRSDRRPIRRAGGEIAERVLAAEADLRGMRFDRGAQIRFWP